MPVAEAHANGDAPPVETFPPARRARMISATIEFNVVADDGDLLTPIPIQPITVLYTDWSTFSPDAVLAEVQARLDAV